jgi:hypothetical protein
MSSVPLVTYSDILEFLLRLENTQDTRVRMMAQAAILSAYQEFPLMRRWKYYYARGRVVTDAEYSTGTVAYDHTGGSNERQLTLSSGTWPTNAARGWVLIDNREYRVASRVSDSIITLSVNSNPGEDIAAGETYVWWRDTYPMPLDFVGADAMIDHNEGWYAAHESPGTTLNWRANDQSSNTPLSKTFLSDPDYAGVMAVMFDPPPDESYYYDFMYVRSPIPMRVLDYSTGTVSVSSTTVTGVDTVWTDDMVGTLIRLPRSGVNQVPTGLDGLYRYAEQRVVTAVASATSLTIDAVLSGTYSGVKYRISDFIDLDYNVMMEAFRKMCEYRFAENLSRQDQGTRFRSYTNALTIAKEADGKRSLACDRPSPVQYWDRWERGRTGSDVS